MSVDISFEPEPHEGLSMGRVKRVLAVRSVDLVSRPDAGGRVLRMVASNPESFEEFSPAAGLDPTAGTKKAGGTMKEKIMRVLQAIKNFAPKKAESFEAELQGLDWNDNAKVEDVHERVPAHRSVHEHNF